MNLPPPDAQVPWLCEPRILRRAARLDDASRSSLAAGGRPSASWVARLSLGLGPPLPYRDRLLLARFLHSPTRQHVPALPTSEVIRRSPMPTLESMRDVAASRPKTVVSTAQSGWQHQVARLMRQRRRFILETSCPTFDPSGYSAPSVWNWVRGQKPHISGCGLPGSLGVTLLGLTLVIS